MGMRQHVQHRQPPYGHYCSNESGRLSCLGPLQGCGTVQHASMGAVCVWRAVSARRGAWLGAIFGQNWAVRAARRDPISPLMATIAQIKVLAFLVWVHCRVVEHSSTLQRARFAFGGPFQPAEVPGWGQFLAKSGRCELRAGTQAAPLWPLLLK